MAGASGTIMHLGIGPIVTGSIIMQLFAGAKIIRLDLQDSEDKAMYQGVQKLLVLLMIPIESIPQTYGFLDPTEALITNYGMGWANFVIVAQLFAGSYLVFLLDELVSKWGLVQVSRYSLPLVSHSLHSLVRYHQCLQPLALNTVYRTHHLEHYR